RVALQDGNVGAVERQCVDGARADGVHPGIERDLAEVDAGERLGLLVPVAVPRPHRHLLPWVPVAFDAVHAGAHGLAAEGVAAAGRLHSGGRDDHAGTVGHLYEEWTRRDNFHHNVDGHGVDDVDGTDVGEPGLDVGGRVLHAPL